MLFHGTNNAEKSGEQNPNKEGERVTLILAASTLKPSQFFPSFL